MSHFQHHASASTTAFTRPPPLLLQATSCFKRKPQLEERYTHDPYGHCNLTSPSQNYYPCSNFPTPLNLSIHSHHICPEDLLPQMKQDPSHQEMLSTASNKSSASLSLSPRNSQLCPHISTLISKKKVSLRSTPARSQASARSPSSNDDSDDTLFTNLRRFDAHSQSNSTIKVKDLPRECHNEELKKTFETYFGPVVAALVVVDRKGTSRGYGFVTMEREHDADRAVRQISEVGLRIRDHIIAARKKGKRTKSLENTHDHSATEDTECLPLPPALELGLSWSEELEQVEAVKSIVNAVRDLSRMKLPLKERNAKKYFHRFLESPDTPPQIQDKFESLHRHHRMEVYKALCSVQK